MAYNKNTWQNGDIITAEKLNNIENGIATNGIIQVVLGENSAELSVSYNEVLELLSRGVIPFFTMNEGGGSAYRIYLLYSFFGEQGNGYDVDFRCIQDNLQDHIQFSAEGPDEHLQLSNSSNDEEVPTT